MIRFPISSFSRGSIFAAVLLAGVFAAAVGPLAADPQIQDGGFAAKVLQWTKTLQAAREELSAPAAARDDAAFEQARSDVERVHDEALESWREASVAADATRKLLEALGPPPKENEPPESEDVAAQREKLKAQVAVSEGRMKQADLIATQASDMLGTFLAAGRERLAQRLLVRGPSPILPEIWAKAIPDFVSTLAQLVAVPLEWLSSGVFFERGVISLGILVAGLIAAFLIGWPLRKYLLRRLGRDPVETEPSYLRRVAAAVVEGVARGLLPSLAVAAVYLTFLSLELFSAHLQPIAAGTCLALVFFISVSSFSRAALAPDTPQWQLAPLEPQNAKTISRVMTAIAAVAAVVIFVHETVRDVQMSLEFRIVFTFVTDTMIAAGMLVLLRRRLWLRPASMAEKPIPATSETEETITGEILKVRRRILPSLRYVMALVAVAIPAAALLGYHRLSVFLTSNLVWTAALIGGLWLLHELAREVIELALTGDEKVSPTVRRALTLSERGSRVLQFWLLFGINFFMIAIGVAAALPIWGLSWSDLSGWLKSSEIGLYLERLTFSLSDIATAFLVFAGILLVTRWLQRALEERIFPQTRLDLGVRHSLKAAVGYIGLIVASIGAISALGLNLTNLALVAGALSVGVGFGLQQIANNFVSGLILLIERPIKVGDWIVVGDKQGFVRRISVRATEIETFQRANVIIPNSEILSTAVVNLTHRDHAGRIDIRVGVAYGSDLDKVRATLIRCAQEHPEVAKTPRPAALLMNFGDSALDFELRVHVDHIEHYWTVSSDIRLAIDKAFRESGIEISFPQTEVRFRDLGGLAAALSGESQEPREATKGMA